MKKLRLPFLLLFVTLPLQAQTGIGTHRQNHAQATEFGWWQHNTAGNTLVATLRIAQKTPPYAPYLPCEPSCGSTIFMVTDYQGNHWQPACTYSVNVCPFWYALNVKAGFNVVGVVASRGQFGGDFWYDMIIVEYPPAIALDSYSQNQYYNGSGNDEPHAGPVQTTASNDLLIFWTNNLSFTPAHSPVMLTPKLGFKIQNDDGFLAMADSQAGLAGSYTAWGEYDAYCQWRAGVAAFRMATPSTTAPSGSSGTGVGSSRPSSSSTVKPTPDRESSNGPSDRKRSDEEAESLVPQLPLPEIKDTMIDLTF